MAKRGRYPVGFVKWNLTLKSERTTCEGLHEDFNNLHTERNEKDHPYATYMAFGTVNEGLPETTQGTYNAFLLVYIPAGMDERS